MVISVLENSGWSTSGRRLSWSGRCWARSLDGWSLRVVLRNILIRIFLTFGFFVLAVWVVGIARISAHVSELSAVSLGINVSNCRVIN